MFKVSACCDNGNAKKINDDRILVNQHVFATGTVSESINENFLCCAVCDGVGGKPMGFRAAEIACEKLADINKHTFRESLKRTIREANDDILFNANDDCRGMATTATGIILCDDEVVTFNIGNSRVCRFRNGFLRQLTVDHTRVQNLLENGFITEEQLKDRKDKNVITRFLGNENYDSRPADVCFQPIKVMERDVFLICSDGLSDYVSIDKIEDILSQEKSLDEKAHMLTKEANDTGGYDNISVILIERENNEG